MPNTSSAEKSMRVADRRRTRNRVARTTARTQVKRAVSVMASKDVPTSEASVREAIRALDKAAAKGIIKKNNAARRKARLMRRLNQLRAEKA